jgi:hypothetical protein
MVKTFTISNKKTGVRIPVTMIFKGYTPKEDGFQPMEIWEVNGVEMHFHDGSVNYIFYQCLRRWGVIPEKRKKRRVSPRIASRIERDYNIFGRKRNSKDRIPAHWLEMTSDRG